MIDYTEKVKEQTAFLLPSQRAYLPSKDSFEKHRCLMAGFRAGKSRVLCTAGILLSHFCPNNFGFLGRASGKDLKQTLIQTFFDEVCPPALIVGKPKSIGQSGLEVTLRSIDPARPSKIYFDYIIDRQEGKFHLAGGNWGWFGISQVEEIQRADYMKLVGRLSRAVPRTFALSEGNQLGHNWTFDDFFASGNYNFNPSLEPNIFYRAIRGENKLGVVVRSEENRKSLGGFVADDYFNELRRTYSPQWQARYLDGSFDDFSGKIYPEYNSTSVHNIEPFDIPSHWPWLVSIDPGGSDPNSVGVWRIDELGNMIRTKEFYQGGVNPNVVINWIRNNVPVNEARYVIDYENKLFMIQLADALNITVEPAMKSVYAGIQQVAGRLWPVKERPLPEWYARTQGSRYLRFKEGGSPSLFAIAAHCPHFVKEHDNYVWDEKNPSEPKKGQSDHTPDDTRYACASRPAPSSTAPQKDKYSALRDTGLDETSVLTAKHRDRVFARMQQERNDKGDFGDTCDEPSFAGDFSW